MKPLGTPLADVLGKTPRWGHDRPILFLLSGQSNMKGQGQVREIQDQKVRDFAKKGKIWNGSAWEDVSPGANTGGQPGETGNVGIETPLAAWGYILTGAEWHFAKYAIGGHALHQNNGQTFHPNGTPSNLPYTSLVAHVSGAIASLTNPIIIEVWNQGENDITGGAQRVSDYFAEAPAGPNPGGLGNLDYFFQQLRTDASYTPDLTILVQISEDFTQIAGQNLDDFRQGQAGWVLQDTANRKLVNGSGFAVKNDGIHLNGFGQQGLARDVLLASMYQGWPDPPGGAPAIQSASLTSPDNIRLTMSAPVYFNPMTWMEQGDPFQYVGNRFGFTITDTNGQSSDTTIEVREVDFSGFGTSQIDLKINRYCDEEAALQLSFDNTGWDIQNNIGQVQNISGLAVTNAITPVIAARRYVDPAAGNDSNDGSMGSPWSTLTKVETELPSLPNHTKIYLQRGTTLTGQDGIDINVPFVYVGGYGTGARMIADNTTTNTGGSLFNVGNTAAVSNVHVSDVRYNGKQDPASTSDGGRLISFSQGNCTDCWLSHSYMNDGWNGALTFRGGTRITYKGCEAYNSKNTTLWQGGDKSATELLNDSLIEDCIVVKDAVYAIEDNISNHASQDGSGNTPMNTAFIGTNNRVRRNASKVSSTAGEAAESPYDGTNGDDTVVELNYFVNEQTSGNGIAIGWSWTGTVRSNYISAALAISAWKDVDFYNNVVNCGSFFKLRSKSELDGNGVLYNPRPTWNIWNNSVYSDDRHAALSYVIGFDFNAGADYTALNVRGNIFDGNGRNQRWLDYTAGALDLTLTSVTSKNAWDRNTIRAENNAQSLFTFDTTGYRNFADWLIAESVTNTTFESSLGGSVTDPLFQNLGLNHALISDFLPAVGVQGTGSILTEVSKDFYQGKDRSQSNSDADRGALQTGFDYTS